MKTGYIISGIGHGLLILWLLVGGFIIRHHEEPVLQVAEVSIVSAAEFAAMTEGPVAPEPPVTAPEPRPETPPAPRPAPAPEVAPEPAPVPEPEPEPEPEPAPEPETPPEAPKVADEVIAPPQDPAPPGPELIEETVPQEAPEPDPAPVEDLPEQAPEASTTEIVTEAETPTPTPVPAVSPRPRPKPTPPPKPEPAPAPEPEPEPAPAAEPDPDAALDDAIEGVLADVLGEATAPDPATAPSGPPLSRGEREGLRLAVQECWNLGSLSTDAMATIVVVMVRMAPDGRPQSVDLVSSNGPNPTATRGAFEAARRAVVRCGARGFPLPAEKYDQWREIEMTFDPSEMRTR